MRLFLSSQDLGNYAEVAAKMAGSNKRAAFIKNAQDYKTAADRNANTRYKREMFEKVGFKFEEIDLRNYFGKKEELTKKLDDFGSIWCAGGNVLVLRRAMKASGLDELLVTWLKNDRVLYGGWSAGAMIMAPDLKGPIWSEEDRADIVPEGYDPETVWDGLGLVAFYVVPHFGSELHGSSPQELADYYKSRGLPYYILQDGHAVVINGDKEKLLT